MRKIIQVVQCNDKYTKALCNDGTLWQYKNQWEKLQDIPQDGYKEESKQNPVLGYREKPQIPPIDKGV